jgi:hypothetical protein
MHKIINQTSFTNLPEYYKEQIAYKVYSFVLAEDNEYFMYWKNSCKCCYGDRKDVFWIINENGDLIRTETEEFLSKITVKERLCFEVNNKHQDIFNFILKIKN